MQYAGWKKEYQKQTPTIPTVSRRRPSSAVVTAKKYFTKNKFEIPGPVLDLGCGNGRNAVYFAKQGHAVLAVDFIEEAIAETRAASRRFRRVRVLKHSLPDRIPRRSGTFGLVLDIVSTSSLHDAEQRRMRKEILRLLKPGGWFVGYHISDSNPEFPYHRIAKGSRFIRMPNGIIDRTRNIPDLVRFYHPLMPCLCMRQRKSDRFGRRNAWIEMITVIFRKEQ